MYCFSTGFNCIVSVLGLIVLFQSWIYLCCFSPGFNCVVSVLDLIVLLQSWILRVDVFFTLNFLTIPDIDPTRTLPIFKAISKTEINLIILSMFLHYKVQYTWCMLSCLRSGSCSVWNRWLLLFKLFPLHPMRYPYNIYNCTLYVSTSLLYSVVE